jgi:hypothetical protein
MKYAQVKSGVVSEVFTPLPGFTIEESFVPEIAAQFEPCPEEVQAGWTKTAGGEFLPPVPFIPVNVSPSAISAYAGDSVILNCEYSYGDCQISYQWFNPGNLPIEGANQSHLTLNNLVEKLDGTYSCNVFASNGEGQVASTVGSFRVAVYPPVTPGAAAE